MSEEPSDFTRYKSTLPPEAESYLRQKAIPLPDDYYDRWKPIIGDYDPIRDEALAWTGVLPFRTIQEGIAVHPGGEPFPIIPRIDRGFPAMYEEQLETYQLDDGLFRALGLDEQGIEGLLYKLQDAQW